MKENLNTILDEIKASLRDMQQNEALQELKVKYLGKKGEITQMMKQMGSLSPEERPAFGQKINALRKKAEEAIEEKRLEISEKQKNARLAAEKIDVTLPSRKNRIGGLHPLTKVILGDSVRFLSIWGSQWWKARRSSWTNSILKCSISPRIIRPGMRRTPFYVTDDIVLRTHTSPVQVRTMLANASRPSG